MLNKERYNTYIYNYILYIYIDVQNSPEQQASDVNRVKGENHIDVIDCICPLLYTRITTSTFIQYLEIQWRSFDDLRETVDGVVVLRGTHLNRDRGEQAIRRICTASFDDG